MGHSEIAGVLTSQVSNMALYPVLAVVVPFLGAILAFLNGKKEQVRNTITILTTLVTFGILFLMYQPVINGVSVGGHVYKCIEYSVPGILGFGINFRVDPVGLTVAFITSLVWIASCIYALAYMGPEHAKTRYYSFALATLGADLGILLTKDFFSLFLFFELLAIFSSILVVHEEDKKTMAAGRLYVYFCVVGGLCLLGGIMLLKHFTGTMNIQPMADLYLKTVPAHLKYVIITLLIIGFGSKAGVFLCHVWLPEAHPVAPTPASCLLSGVMIKAGAYGILRTVCTLFAPVAPEAASTHVAASVAHGVAQAGHAVAANAYSWTTLTTLGYALIWLGVITMFYGVINALITPNCKRMLAFHSVSQMGYIIFGIGTAAYLGRDGAMGMAGALYHIVNHALFKAVLFLSVGAIYFRTHELDMYKLGGMWKKMPFVGLCCLFAVCGIAGVPFFNGYASKTILHHAAIESIAHSVHFSATHKPDVMLRVAEVFFILTAFGTFCSNTKMWLFLFIWKRPDKYKDVQAPPMPMQIGIGILTAAIVFVGLKPNWMLESLIGPSLAYFGFDPASHPYHILFNIHATGAIRSTIPILYDPKTYAFLNPEVLHNMAIAGLEMMGGAMYFVLGYRFAFFHYAPPDFLTFKIRYMAMADWLRGIFTVFFNNVSLGVNRSYYGLAENFLKGITVPFNAISQMVNVLYLGFLKKFIASVSAISVKASEQVNFQAKLARNFILLESEISLKVSEQVDLIENKNSKNILPNLSRMFFIISQWVDGFYKWIMNTFTQVVPANSINFIRKIKKDLVQSFGDLRIFWNKLLSVPAILFAYLRAQFSANKQEAMAEYKSFITFRSGVYRKFILNPEDIERLRLNICRFGRDMGLNSLIIVMTLTAILLSSLFLHFFVF